MVADGRIPRAKTIDARNVWDIRALDLRSIHFQSEGDANP